MGGPEAESSPPQIPPVPTCALKELCQEGIEGTGVRQELGQVVEVVEGDSDVFGVPGHVDHLGGHSVTATAWGDSSLPP